MIAENFAATQFPPMKSLPENHLSESIASEMRPDKIGGRMKLLREAVGMSPAEMADHLGIERTYWSRFENGRRAINDATAALLVERFGVTLDFIILGRWSGLPMDLANRMRAIQTDEK